MRNELVLQIFGGLSAEVVRGEINGYEKVMLIKFPTREPVGGGGGHTMGGSHADQKCFFAQF